MKEVSTPESRISQKIEGKEQSRRLAIISDIANQYFPDTALVQERPWQERDATQVREFLIDAAPYVSPRLYPNYWEHILLASVTGKKLAEKANIPDLPPQEAETTGLLHDCGRLMVPHRYYRNDVMGNALLKQTGVRAEVVDTFPPLDRILGMHHPIDTIEELTVAQKINHVADNLGKRDAAGNLVTPEDIIKYSSGSVYRQPLWPSERNALEYLNLPGKEVAANRLVYAEAMWLQDQFGIDFADLRSAVETEFATDKNQQWLLTVKNAQETLDQGIDTMLGRPSINHIVFDLGGVLLQDPNTLTIDMRENMAKLAANKSLNLLFYTDSTLDVADQVRDTFRMGYPELAARPLFASSETDTSKAEGTAFPFILDQLDNPDPQTVLMIDDREAYTTKARSAHNMRGFTFREGVNETSAERVQRELQGANLL